MAKQTLVFDRSIQNRENKKGEAYKKAFVGVFEGDAQDAIQDFSPNTGHAIWRKAMSDAENGITLKQFAEELRVAVLKAETLSSGLGSGPRRG